MAYYEGIFAKKNKNVFGCWTYLETLYVDNLFA